MPDNESKVSSLDLITEITSKLAREIGAMELDDPRRAQFLRELSDLIQLRQSFRPGGNQSIGQRIDELAREMATLKPGDTRRTEILNEVMRLRDLLKQN